MTGPDATGCYDLSFSKYSAHLSHPGKAIALNAASAATIALQNGIRFDQLRDALEDYPGERGRMQYEEIRGVHFYNDAYNANPASASAGFETMAEIKTTSRKMLIFADMLELGDLSTESHTQAAVEMLEAGFDHIILFGEEVSNSYKYLKEHGFTSLYCDNDKTQSLHHFMSHVRVGDLVYLKGSRGMRLEDYIKAYKENN